MTTQIETIHVVFKTHLDVGYTDMPHKIVQKYLDEYIPGAIETARTLQEMGGEEQYIWTTGSWLLFEYLEREPAEKRALLESAIRDGLITWHGLPFSAHNEMLDASLYQFGLSLSKRLDERFGKQTIAAKITDVPGDTRAVIHHLADAGIRLLHIGVNPVSAVPDFPQVCLWKDPDGKPGDEIILVYHGTYGSILTVPGLSHALYFAITNDNLGPHTPEDVQKIFCELKTKYPGGRVIASTLDAFTREILKMKDSLPVITAENGNSWIHGAASDPTKVSAFRELMRLRARWEQEGKVSINDPRFEKFSRRLLTVAEHTWGLDEKIHLNDYQTFNPEQLANARHLPNFRKAEAAWKEEHLYLTQAVEALEDLPFKDEAVQALEKIRPCYPSLNGYEAVEDFAAIFTTGRFELRLDPATGAIQDLIDRKTGRVWAAGDNQLALFRHQTFSQADFDRFIEQYLTQKVQWGILDFTRPGVDNAGAKSAWWLPRLTRLWKKSSGSGLQLVVELEMDDEAVSLGSPKRATVEISVPESEPAMDITLQWFDKPANRLPETLWFSFRPVGCIPEGWMVEKIDRWISPLEVVARSGRRMHGVNSGVRYRYNDEQLAINTLDAPAVAPGAPRLWDFIDELPDLNQGMHFNLCNNMWATNFPIWFEGDARFRFVLQFG